LKRGLVIGKFMPLHKGHVALINFAADQCDEVIVSMSYTEADPIPSNIRFDWLIHQFKDDSRIIPRLIPDTFDDPHLSLNERTKQWSSVIGQVYPRIDLIFSSEEYGEPFAKNLGAKHISFDPQRKTIPISGSEIRKKPMTNWDFIPTVVQPYFVKKICFYGAESTGKSTMAEKMAAKFSTVSVPEVAREMITSNDFSLNDIIEIGKAHYKRIMEATRSANKILICDTDVLTTQIYSDHYLHEVPQVLYQLEQKTKYDKYFLLDIDVPWVADGLRDLGHRREEIHNRFKHELERRNISFVLVSGGWDAREKIITTEIEKLLRDE
jgi:HTH-type transcriptional regulator, transcriptional repressor of NAD biosynthesis genes